MPLINTAVPNLIQGVSQQSDASRYDGQCEIQENALSSVASGLKKRPNTRHVGKLLSREITDDSFIHFIDRSATEKYCITQDSNKLTIHNALTGKKCTITEQSTSDFVITNDEVDTTGTYLESASARKDIKPLTIGDSTFLLNTDKETALDPTKTTLDLSDEALIFVKQGDYKKKYGFKIQGRVRNGSGESAQIRTVSERHTLPSGSRVWKLRALNPQLAPETSVAFIADKGSGFAPNDIVNITLAGTSSYTVNESGGQFLAQGNLPLNIYTQPTLKVLTTDNDGGILTATIEEAGAYIYEGNIFGSDGTDYGYFSTGGGTVVSTVFSSNSSSTSASGLPATLSVLQGSNPAWNEYSTYSATNASTTVTNVNIITAGSGFAVGDILDLPESQFPQSRQWNAAYHMFALADQNTTLFLNWVTTPKVRVTGIDSNGGIESIEVADGGRYGYGDYVGLEYSNTDSINSTMGYFGNLSIESTNNTVVNVVTTDEFVGQRVITSGTSIGSNGSAVDSSVILQALSGGTDPSINANFDTDISNINSNLLIVKPKIITTSGQPYTDFYNVTPVDGLSGEGMGVVHREVSSITDLPLVAIHGYRVKVVGDAELGQDDFYCEFNLSSEEPTKGEVGQGTWVECAGGLVVDEIDASTMPRQLVNVAPNIFQLRRMSFDSLSAGDEISNPSPSFINDKINNMFQYKNRLGFLCQGTVIMSESGFGGFDSLLDRQNFNFFRTTVNTLLDSDPIDVTVASNRVTNLKAAKGFQENLVLFSANGQFVLKGGDLLTPKTVSITPITNFSFEDQVEPLPLGSYIYFPFTRGEFTGLREFTVNASSDTYDAAEVTEHVPSYIPKEIIDMAGTSSEDSIVLLSKNDTSSLYIYNYFWSNNQKILSAWSKFTFNGNIRGVEFIESTLYAIISGNGETNLVKMPLESGLKDAAGYVTHLDMRVSASLAGEVLGTSVNNTPESGDSYTPFTGSWTSNGLSTTIEDTTAYGNGVELANSVGSHGTATINLSTPIPSGTTVNITSTVLETTGLASVKWEFVTSGGLNASPYYGQAVNVTGNDTVTTTAEATQIRIRIINSGTLKISNIAVTTQGYIPASTTTTTTVVTPAEDTITLPYTPSDNTVQVYTTDGLKLNCTNSGATVTLSSPVSTDTDVWVGIPYTMKYTFSEQLFKAKAGNGKSPSNAAKLMIRNGSLYYADSAFFKVKVTPKFRDTYENFFNPDIVGSTTLGSLSLDSGFYRFPVFTKAQDTAITIENDTALPSTFQSAEFESFLHARSSRYA